MSSFELDQVDRNTLVRKQKQNPCTASNPFPHPTPNSPDLNVLDLGAWHSMQKAVPAIVFSNTAGAVVEERIKEAVQTSFHQWNAKEKCSKLFSTLKAFMAQTIIEEGQHTKKQP